MSTKLEARRHGNSPWGLQSAGVFYALVSIPLIFGSLTGINGIGGYADVLNLANVLDQAVLVGVLAIFTTIVLVSGNFDLSIGSTAALAAVVALKLSSLPPGLTLVICVAIGMGVGLVNGLIVQFIGVNAFITTLATQTAIRGVVFLTAGGTSVTANVPAFHAMSTTMVGLNFALIVGIGGLILIAAAAWLWIRSAKRSLAVVLAVIGVVAGVGSFVLPKAIFLTTEVLIMVGLTVAVALVLRFTVLGRRLYAVGSNAEAARLSGVSVDRYRIGAFMASGGAAAFVGLIFIGRYQSMTPQALTGVELTAITACVLGGTSLFGGIGSVVKSVIGALILTALSNGMNFMNVDTSWQGLISGIVLVAAAAIYTVGRGEGRRIMDLARRFRRPPAGPQKEHRGRAEGSPVESERPAAHKEAGREAVRAVRR